MVCRRLFGSALVLAVAGQGCGLRPAPSQPSSSATGDSADRPYSRVVRQAVETYYPELLTTGVEGSAAYLWLVADGRGRITRRSLSSARPRTLNLRNALLEKFPDVDVDRDAKAVPDAAFATAGTSIHPPPELGPDTVYLFWADQPYSVRNVPPALGPFLLGRAASEQVTPARIRELAQGATPDDVIWYVYTDEESLVEAGIFQGLRPHQTPPDSIVSVIRDLVRSKYPGGSLTCSLGTSLPNRNGDLVMTMSVRYEPRKP